MKMRSNLQRAFTLVELMIAVAIILIIAVLAVINFQKFLQEQKIARYVFLLKEGVAALEMYSAVNGDYPMDVMQGEMPVGMAGYMPVNFWLEATPLGGYWDYDRWGASIGGAPETPTALVSLSLYSSGDETVSDETMLEIDRRIDDNNLTTGTLRKFAGGRFLYYLMREGP